ncbi:MAG: AsmA family protein [Nitrospiraceae bacterium]|nr:MAG: AsmA family protein [Nitrospiraceae bacterium]
MNAKKKKVLFILGGGAVALVLAVVIFALTFDINSYKPRIEAAASGATGLDVRINGKMGLSFIPFGISAKDIHVAHKGGEILSLENLKIGVELMPLLKKQLKVTSCELVKPGVTIVKDSEGKYNFEGTEKKSTEERPGAAFSLNEFKLSKGVLVYIDKKTGAKTEFKDFNLAVKDLSIAGDVIKSASFTGSFDCKEVRKGDLKIDNVKSPIKAEKGVIYLMSLTMDIFGAKAEGDATADKSEADAVYKINLKISKLDFEKLQESFGTKKVIGGKGDLHASLTMKEKGSRKLISGMDGTFSLRGDNLVIYTMDLDTVLSKYEASQKFNLVDLGAFFIAGPLGTVALKGYRYGDVYHQTQGGQGSITQFISQWKIRDGVADATDCALATRHNRIALKGKLNLVSERYDNVIVALLDDKGCAKFKQSISGSFGSPEVSPVSTVGFLAEPIFDLYRKAKRFVQGGKCEVFYNGAVQQPR